MEIPYENTNQANNDKDNIIEIEIPYPLFQYLSSEECNLQNICRICLSMNEQVLISLYSSKENYFLADVVMAITGLQIKAEDGLPASICQICETKLKSYNEFKIKCIKSDYTLKSVLKGEFINKELITKCKNDLEIKREQKSSNKTKTISSGLIIKEEPTYIDTEYLKNIQNSMSDDEPLNVVQDTKFNDNNKITVNDKTLIKNTYMRIKKKMKEKTTDKSKTKTRYICKLCHKKFNKYHSLRTHITKIHVTLKKNEGCEYPCEDCKESFDVEFDLHIHKMLHTQYDNWKCTVCQKNFKDKTSLRRHIMRHMKSRRFRCTACEASFVELYALRRHMRVHTGEQLEKKHPCSMCDEKFIDMSRLREHMARHGERTHVCSECGATFGSVRLLTSHTRVHSADKPHECLHCGRRFRHESTRNTHQRTHTGERPYVCTQCGKSFIQKSNLTLHMRTHTGEKPYSCSMCDRKFSSGSSLKTHKRRHTGERPYTCKVCGKSFAYMNLKQHMRLHTGERPFGCSACHKRFSTAPRLKEHFRLHTGEKPFECAICAIKFRTKSQLISHIKQHEKLMSKEHKTVIVSLKPTSVITNRKINNKQLPQKMCQNVMLPVENIHSTQENIIQEGLVYQDDGNIKTEVIVLDNESNYIPNNGNMVTVNEGELSISTASAMVDGTTVKMYQYDQSLLQIHTGGGQLIVSRVSSKMTTNF